MKAWKILATFLCVSERVGDRVRGWVSGGVRNVRGCVGGGCKHR